MQAESEDLNEGSMTRASLRPPYRHRSGFVLHHGTGAGRDYSELDAFLMTDGAAKDVENGVPSLRLVKNSYEHDARDEVRQADESR